MKFFNDTFGWYNSNNCKPGTYDYDYRWHEKDGSVKKDFYGRERFLKLFSIWFKNGSIKIEHSERGFLCFLLNFKNDMVYCLGWWNKESENGSIRTFKDQLKNIYDSWSGACDGCG